MIQRHLRPEDWMAVLDGAPLRVRQQDHLDTCRTCQSERTTLVEMRDAVAGADNAISEPDWTDFGEGVRRRIVARSIERQTSVRRWTGWAVRPAVAWAASLLVAVVVTAAVAMYIERPVEEPRSVNTVPAPAALPDDGNVGPAEPLRVVTEPVLVEAELAGWSSGGIFEELEELNPQEERQLRELLSNTDGFERE